MLNNEQQFGSNQADAGVERLAAQENGRSSHRQLNVPLLLFSLTLFAVLLVAGKFWHTHKKLQLADAFLQRADQLESEEKWPQAMTYLQRYLWINPDDLDKRLQLIDVFEKGVQSPRDQKRLSSMLYELLGLIPERTDLRLRLAKSFLAQRGYDKAEKEARTAIRSAGNDSTQLAQARRLIALSLYPRARESVGSLEENQSTQLSAKEKNNSPWARRAEGVSIGSAAQALADSLEDLPGDIELATVTAEFYRRYQSTLNSKSLNAAKFADGVMERLLQEKSHDPDALVSNYHYRSRYKLVDAKACLAKALELAPDHSQALILNAAESARQADSPQEALDVARSNLLRAIDGQPKDNQAYIVLSRLQSRAGDLDGSIQTLQEGKQRVGASNFLLGRELTSRLFEAKKLPEAEEALAELDAASQSQFLQYTAASRREIENQLRILHSKISIQKGDLHGALVELKVVAAATSQDSSTVNISSGLEAHRLLGVLTEKLQYWDLAASYWSRLTVDAPRYGEAHRRAGLAYLQIQQPGKAVDHLEQYLRPSPPTAWSPQEGALLTLLQARLKLQLQRSSESQNWAEFIETLEQVKQRLPGRWETCFAEADYLLAQGTSEAREQASKLLVAAEKEHVSEPVFWRNLVRGYSNLKKPADAQRALRQYDKLESAPFKRGLVRANMLARNEQYDAAETVLVGLLPDSDPETRHSLQLQRLNILLAAKQTTQAHGLLKELIASRLDDSRLLTLGIETMLKAGDLLTAENWENKLQRLDLPEDYLWRYFRASRFLQKYKSLTVAEQTELRQLIASLISSRPEWHGVVGLAAHYAELRGNTLQAINHYERAIKLGGNSTSVLQRLVLLLNNEGRFTEADAYLNRLSARQGGTLQVESLEISSALRNDQMPDAIKLARDAVERHPDDPQRLVWLAGLLSLDKQSEPAEAVYRNALVKFPEDIRLWNGLFTLLVKSQQVDKASIVLETLVQPFESEPAKKHFALAHGYLQLGNRERAASECQQTLEADPGHIACRLLHAKLLMAADTPSAEKQLKEVLKRDANNGEAKRLLASIWTSSGRPADSDLAMELLETLTSESTLEHQANNRLRAQLLSGKGRSRQERRDNIIAARRIMEEQLEHSQPAVDVDRLLLAKIHEAEALLLGDSSALQASREQWQLLLDRPQVIVQYQLQYLDFLFRQLSRPSEDPLWQGDWKYLRDAFLSEAEVRISALENYLQETPSPDVIFHLIGYQVQLQKVQGELASASQLLNEFAKQTLPGVEASLGKARSYLAMGNLYASLEQHKQSAEWYRKLSGIAPQTYVLLVRELAAQGQLNEAIDVCIASQDKIKDSSASVAAVLAQLVSTAGHDSEERQRAQPIIDAALGSHGDNVELLLAVAVLKVTQGENDAAIQHFQRVLKLVPEHPLALNNLATLLSETSNQLSEALSYIEQAIQISGRQPALLDTLGTIQFRMGEFKPAIVSLEEAVSIGRVDARYYFHLAVAYQKADQTEKSRDSLLRARQSGLEKMILTQGDQQLLKNLEQQIDSNKS